MITRDLISDKYGWQVRVFFPVTCYHIDHILDSLSQIDCPDRIKDRVSKNIRRHDLDTGFTFSNKKRRQTVMVIGKTSSPAEFLNSFEHELRHLIDDIASCLRLKSPGEEVAYMTGEFNRILWNDIHKFICCKCYDRRRD